MICWKFKNILNSSKVKTCYLCPAVVSISLYFQFSRPLFMKILYCLNKKRVVWITVGQTEVTHYAYIQLFLIVCTRGGEGGGDCKEKLLKCSSTSEMGGCVWSAIWRRWRADLQFHDWWMKHAFQSSACKSCRLTNCPFEGEGKKALVAVT